jgi:nickel-dependent lactate racemase
MAKFKVTVNVTYQKEITVFANDEAEAKEKATDIVKEWSNVHDVEAVDAEEQ